MKTKKVLFVVCLTMIAMFVVTSAMASEEAAMPAEVTEAIQALDINTASAEELGALSGMDAAKAAAVVEYREANGPFTSTDDLKNVSGMDDATLEAINSLISVTAPH